MRYLFGFALITITCVVAAKTINYIFQDKNEPIVYVDKVTDGDTIVVTIPEWHPVVGRRIPVRIRGIDAPELNDADPEIRAIAVKAKEFLAAELKDYHHVVLKNMSRDKYFRIDADIFVGFRQHTSLADLLIEKRLALPYDGGTKPVFLELK